jgi:hypothetical protein
MMILKSSGTFVTMLETVPHQWGKRAKVSKRMKEVIIKQSTFRYGSITQLAQAQRLEHNKTKDSPKQNNCVTERTFNIYIYIYIYNPPTWIN